MIDMLSDDCEYWNLNRRYGEYDEKIPKYIITNISIHEVPNWKHEYLSQIPIGSFPLFSNNEATIEVTRELINIRRFNFSDGESYGIGFVDNVEKKFHKTFGIWLKVLDDNEKELRDRQKVIDNYKQRFIDVLNMSFWKRLKFLFTKEV